MSKIMHATKNSLPEKNRLELACMLNKTLGTIQDLQMQLKQAHWNVKGLNFIAVHELLDTIAEEVEHQVDLVAERITALGGTAAGTIAEVAKNTALRAYPTDIFTVKEHVDHLTHNLAIAGELTRNNIAAAEEFGDMVTSDLYIGLTRLLDHRLWFLEAHIQK